MRAFASRLDGEEGFRKGAQTGFPGVLANLRSVVDRLGDGGWPAWPVRFPEEREGCASSGWGEQPFLSRIPRWPQLRER